MFQIRDRFGFSRIGNILNREAMPARHGGRTLGTPTVLEKVETVRHSPRTKEKTRLFLFHIPPDTMHLTIPRLLRFFFAWFGGYGCALLLLYC